MEIIDLKHKVWRNQIINVCERTSSLQMQISFLKVVQNCKYSRLYNENEMHGQKSCFKIIYFLCFLSVERVNLSVQAY